MTTELSNRGNILNFVWLHIGPQSEAFWYSPQKDLWSLGRGEASRRTLSGHYLAIVRAGRNQRVIERIPNQLGEPTLLI